MKVMNAWLLGCWEVLVVTTKMLVGGRADKPWEVPREEEGRTQKPIVERAGTNRKILRNAGEYFAMTKTGKTQTSRSMILPYFLGVLPFLFSC